MTKIDLRKELKHLYAPSAKKVEVVEVPEFQFAMIDGRIEPGEEPGTSSAFQQALEALYGISYTLKFMSKLRDENPIDYTVMALEGLWWTSDGEFDFDRKDTWQWTAMILQPDHITPKMFAEALEQLRKKRGDSPALAKLRLERFHEGLCMQVMHIGPYAEEPRTIERMMAFARENGYRVCGKHHEIYLGDPRRARPEKLKTILRHPVESMTWQAVRNAARNTMKTGLSSGRRLAHTMSASNWQTYPRGDPLPWLLEHDPANPGVRYFALLDLLDQPEDDPEVRHARADIMATGPVPAILDAQYPEGYWIKPGGGYSPKYRSTVWQIIFLAGLGADPADEQVQRGCEYLLSHSIAANGAFSAHQKPVPSGAVHCLNGNLLYALQRLGYADDPRVQAALGWLVRAITGEGEIQYLKSGTSGPGFACSINEGQPCGWGAAKAMKALIAIPPDQRTSAIERAIEVGAEFLLGRDPAVADYPYTGRVSSTWFKFGFPLSYWSDVLETTMVLAELGYGTDPRLENALNFIMSKQDAQGRWKLENAINGKMWADIEEKGKPSKWVTLRALRVLKRVKT